MDTTGWDLNPYNWQSNVLQVEVPRAEVDEVRDLLLRGASAVLLGGRGMGKSVFLEQLRGKLEETPGAEVRLVASPPPEMTVRAFLDKLAQVLDLPGGQIDTQTLLEAWFAREGDDARLILLFDEFDNYAEIGENVPNRPAGRAFFNNLEASRRALPGLGVLAAGSIGIFFFRDVLGSSFLSRAKLVRLASFDRDAATELARPFRDRGTALSDEVLEALHLSTGGIPALLAYGLQELWTYGLEVGVRDVAEAFVEFERSHRGYLDDILRSFSHPRLSQAPHRVWKEILQAQGRLPRSRLVAACQGTGEALDLSLADVLDILQAAGLVRVESTSYAVDPIRVHPTASLLNLPEASREATGFREQLLADLRRLLEMLHRSATDFFRPGKPSGEDGGKRLVPEAVFAAHLTMGFELLGWRSEREAQSAAGRTDLKLWHNGEPERAVVEVKIWGRNDYRMAQRQVESYWAQDVAAGAVVQLTDAELADWPDRYRRECLADEGISIEELALEDSPIRAAFSCTSRTPDGQDARIDHFLLRLPRRL